MYLGLFVTQKKTFSISNVKNKVISFIILSHFRIWTLTDNNVSRSGAFCFEFLYTYPAIAPDELLEQVEPQFHMFCRSLSICHRQHFLCLCVSVFSSQRIYCCLLRYFVVRIRINKGFTKSSKLFTCLVTFENEHVLLMNTQYAHFNGFCAYGVSRGLATSTTVTRELRGRLGVYWTGMDVILIYFLP